MKKYILGRFIRSVISVLAVVCIAIVLIFTLMPRNMMFEKDPTYNKLQGDSRTTYAYSKWDDLGYLDFVKTAEMCKSSSDFDACLLGDDADVVSEYESNGYTIGTYLTGSHYAYKDYTVVELVTRFFSRLITIDNPMAIDDASNPNLERGYYVEAGPNGIPAIKCSGCNYQYQLYINGTFPFIHQNIVQFSFGKSYPTYSGVETLEVISATQGMAETKPTKFPTGITANSSVNLYSCKYKSSSTLDHIDTARFDTNYASCSTVNESPAMTTTSYIFGLISLVLAYALAIPAGIVMARNKDKWQDKLGMVYINFMIAVPSLAFIYFSKSIGLLFGLPDKFPQFGFGDVRSYILPIVILSLLSTSGTMIWIRRYMIDQSNSDYVKFARAKGLNEKEIFSKHVLKNAIIPIVNGIPSSIVLCISGSVITESVFAIPGMGKMLPDAIKSYNNNMVITLTFIFTALSIFSLLMGDILMTIVDPRIQLSAKGDSR